jgi:formate dehydrogenase major subunit
VTRREFLVVSGTAAAGTVVLGGLGFDLSPAQAYARELRIKVAKETTTICCCSVGCGILVHTRDGNVINTEGDPDHPVSEGSLCPKGGTLSQVVTNANRLLKPRYRAPGATAWKDVEWDWALDRIARRVKETRDRTFGATTKTKIREKRAADTPDESGLYPEIVVDVEKEFVVNRTDGIAHVGSAALARQVGFRLDAKRGEGQSYESLEPDKAVLEATIASYCPSAAGAAGGGRGQTKAGSTTHR